jgi:hypothetical protein
VAPSTSPSALSRAPCPVPPHAPPSASQVLPKA